MADAWIKNQHRHGIRRATQVAIHQWFKCFVQIEPVNIGLPIDPLRRKAESQFDSFPAGNLAASVEQKTAIARAKAVGRQR